MSFLVAINLDPVAAVVWGCKVLTARTRLTRFCVVNR